MTNKRFFYALFSGLVLTVLLVAASVWAGNRLLKKSAAKLNDTKLEAAVVNAQQTALTRAKQDIKDYSEYAAIANTVVPKDKDQARTVREIVQFAKDTSVPITSITFPNSELGIEKPATTTPSASENGGNSSASSTAPQIPPVSQFTPVTGLKGVYQMQITIQNDQKNLVSYNNFIRFIQRLEGSRRTSQIASVNLQPDTKVRSQLTYTMIINIYVKP